MINAPISKDLQVVIEFEIFRIASTYFEYDSKIKILERFRLSWKFLKIWKS